MPFSHLRLGKTHVSGTRLREQNHNQSCTYELLARKVHGKSILELSPADKSSKIFSHFYYGKVAEWSKAQHWKCCVLQGTGGSNPSLSASAFRDEIFVSFFISGKQMIFSIKIAIFCMAFEP